MTASSSRSLVPCRSAVWMVIESLGCFALLFQLLALIVVGERREQRVQPAFHYQIELVQGQADAMIGDAILREVVGADFFATIARTHHALPLGADRLLLLFEFDFVEPRPQYPLGLGTILDLRFFVLAGDDQTRRQVREAHG